LKINSLCLREKQYKYMSIESVKGPRRPLIPPVEAIDKSRTGVAKRPHAKAEGAANTDSETTPDSGVSFESSPLRQELESLQAQLPVDQQFTIIDGLYAGQCVVIRSHGIAQRQIGYRDGGLPITETVAVAWASTEAEPDQLIAINGQRRYIDTTP